MKIEHAYTIIKEDIASAYGVEEAQWEAVLTIGRNLKRRLPKTPIETDDGFICRSCGYGIKRIKYCNNCGQKITWKGVKRNGKGY